MAHVKTLEVVIPGALTTVQDLGRVGFAQFGVPPSGAVDAFSLRVANLLVGNREDDAGLEITVIGPRLRALTDSVIAVAGADLQPVINGKPCSMWRSHVLEEGDIVSFQGARSGCRAYLAVGGGIDVPVVMNSRSTHLASQFGGFEGRPLRKGDILCCQTPGSYSRNTGRSLPYESIPSYPSDQQFSVISGPQDQHFSDAAKKQFFTSPFQVTSQSDRAGIRLEGPRIEALAELDASIISEGVVRGAVQVPGDGQPIILLGETVTGGYRKIASVISADLPRLGQLKPGDTVRFSPVSMEEALRRAEATEQTIRGLKRRQLRFPEGGAPHPHLCLLFA